MEFLSASPRCTLLVSSQMALPDALDMRDWKAGGTFVGYWRRTGESVVDERIGRRLLSDYVPYNFSGGVVSTALGKKRKKTTDYGYWKLHLPMVNRTVDFHRQLLQDFLQDSSEGFDCHHGPRGRDFNRIADLEKKVAEGQGGHRSDHGKQGGEGGAGKRKARPRKSKW